MIRNVILPNLEKEIATKNRMMFRLLVRMLYELSYRPLNWRSKDIL